MIILKFWMINRISDEQIQDLFEQIKISWTVYIKLGWNNFMVPVKTTIQQIPNASKHRLFWGFEALLKAHYFPVHK